MPSLKVVVRHGRYVYKYEVVVIEGNQEVMREMCDTKLGAWWYAKILPKRWVRKREREAQAGGVIAEFDVDAKRAAKGGFFRK